VPETETHNLRQIEALNQRGGRTLSIVDLILADTITAEAAAYVGEAIGRGASFLTAANPGGAGKTALLAALLAFLPEGVPIVTVDGPDVLEPPDPGAAPCCCLAHEIGAGHWYGYLWGEVVARYLRLARGPHSIASCLHADTREELHAALLSPPLAVSRDDLLAVDFLLFMHVDAVRGQLRRRVSAIYQTVPPAGEHRLIFRWDRSADALRAAGSLPPRPEAAGLARFLDASARAGLRDFSAFRRAYLAFREDRGPGR